MVRLAFEESIYALADYAVRTGEVPPTFRFEVVEADPRGDAAEQEMARINQVLDQARKAAEADKDTENETKDNRGNRQPQRAAGERTHTKETLEDEKPKIV